MCVRGHMRGEGKEGKQRTSCRFFKNKIVAAVSENIHLCDMVSRDTGAFDHQSENAFCRTGIISILITKIVGIATTK